jgi:hypothetical protein
MKKLTLVLAGLLPFLAYAHEGHGHTEGFTIIHYLVEPVHLITLLAGSLLLYVFSRNLVRKRNKD